jgi:hypothetical protein
MILFLYLLIWALTGMLAIFIFDKLDNYKTDWKSYICGALSGPAGLVIICLYVVLMVALKIYDSIRNWMKGIN